MIPVLPTSPQMPQWEHINTKFDTDYPDLKKGKSTNILAIQVRKHLNNKYQNHIKIARVRACVCESVCACVCACIHVACIEF